MVGFALSCFGLLLFLWLAFGGSMPAEAEGLPLHGRVPRGHAARQGGRRPHLRRAGRQGQASSSSTRAGLTLATIELESRVRAAPRRRARDPAPEDAARRDLRRADARYPRRAEAGRTAGAWRPRRSRRRCELDEIFRSFDAQTRTAFRRGWTELAQGVRGRGQDINNALGNLGAVRRERATLLRRSSTTRHGAVRRLVRNTGEVFDALTERDGQLRSADRQLQHASSRRPRARDRGAGGRRSASADVRARVARTLDRLDALRAQHRTRS